jgi:phosphonate dehydrogenase
VLTHAAHPDALAVLAPVCETVVTVAASGEPLALAGVDPARVAALMAFMPDRVNPLTISHLPNLRVVAGAFKGADNVDLAYCTARGIWVTVVRDALTESTAELALALVLAATRRVREGDAIVRREGGGSWRSGVHGFGLRDETIGIVGAGAVGSELGRMLRSLGAEPACSDPAARPAHMRNVPLEQLMGSSRVVVLALPLTAQTHRLIDAQLIGSMSEGSILVNIGRGSTVDEQAVADALDSGHLAAYGSDVFAVEDACNRRATPPSLLRHPRSVFTPHLGSATARTRRAVERQAARSIVQALSGARPDGALNEPTSVSRAPEMEVCA